MIVFILIVFILYNIKFKKNDFFNDSCNIENTLSIKGIFVILVFFAHISEYLILNQNIFDSSYFKLKQAMGQLIVVYFLFFSGYGLFYSIKKGGKKYVNNMMKNRILRTLIHFDFVILLYLIVQFLLNVRFPIRIIILSLIGWETIGNSNWYIFAIIYLFLSTYISFKISINYLKKNEFYGLLINTLFIFVYIVFMHLYKSTWWYDTVICYLLGMYYCSFKNKIDDIFKNNYYLLIILVFMGLVFVRHISNYYISFFLKEIFFITFILMISMKLRIKNKYLDFFGKNIFGMYILQRLPMLILSYYKIHEINFYLFLIVSFILTIALTVIVNKILNKIDSYIFI